MTKRSRILVRIAVVLLTVATLVVATTGSKPTTVRIKVTGPAGRNVEGSLDVDGESRKEVGVIPTEFVVEGGAVSFEVSGPAGEKFKVEIVCGSLGPGGYSEGTDIIRGRIIGPKFFGMRRERVWWGRHLEDR